MSLFQLYLFTVILPNIHGTFSTLSFLSLILWILTIVIYGVCSCVALDSSDARSAMPYIKYGFKFTTIIVIICTFFDVTTPSEKQLYTIAGGYVATNTQDVAKLPDNVVKAVNAWLEKATSYADDKKPEKKDEDSKTDSKKNKKSN